MSHWSENLEKQLKNHLQKHPQKPSETPLLKQALQRLKVNPAAQTSGLLLALFLCLAPLFLVTVRGWSNGILIIGAFFCLIFLALNRHRRRENTQFSNQNGALVVVTLLSPFLAVAISSAMRSSLYLPQFDSPARLCLAIPVFIFVVRTEFNAAKYLQFAFPAALLITLAEQSLVTQPMHWGTTRMATYFADPLVFGYVSMTFGLISAVSINLMKKDSPLVVVFKLLGAFVGFYLSIKSGSRTGWMAIPIVLGFWAYQHSSGSKRAQVFCVVALSCLIAALIYFTSSTVHPRVDLIVNEIVTYPWTGTAPETAVGSRITFLRIAGDLFFQNPLGGFGDTRFEQFAIPAKIQGYASATTLDTAFKSGFHNEIVTNAIRSGIFGLLSSAALFIVPFVVFFKKLKSDVAFDKAKANAVIGVTFVICMFVSSLSTEILDLKYTASFYALMVALLCGSTLAHHEQD